MRRPTEGTLFREIKDSVALVLRQPLSRTNKQFTLHRDFKSIFCTQTQITSESLIDLSSAPQVTNVNWSISVQTRGESWQRPARNVAVKPKWACRIFEIHRWREGWVHVSQRGRFYTLPDITWSVSFSHYNRGSSIFLGYQFVSHFSHPMQDDLWEKINCDDNKQTAVCVKRECKHPDKEEWLIWGNPRSRCSLNFSESVEKVEWYSKQSKICCIRSVNFNMYNEPKKPCSVFKNVRLRYWFYTRNITIVLLVQLLVLQNLSCLSCA